MTACMPCKPRRLTELDRRGIALPAAAWHQLLTDIAGEQPAKLPFKSHPIGYCPIDSAEVRTPSGFELPSLYLEVGVPDLF
jgi:hypothetical protein